MAAEIFQRRMALVILCLEGDDLLRCQTRYGEGPGVNICAGNVVNFRPGSFRRVFPCLTAANDCACNIQPRLPPFQRVAAWPINFRLNAFPRAQPGPVRPLRCRQTFFRPLHL